jgi:hypothetical protein
MNSWASVLPLLPLFTDAPAALEDAQRLSEEAESAVAAFFREGTSRNTARTYKTALQYWGAWHALRYGTAIVASVSPSVVNYAASTKIRPGEDEAFFGARTRISISLPSAVKKVIRRSTEKPSSL